MVYLDHANKCLNDWRTDGMPRFESLALDYHILAAWRHASNVYVQVASAALPTNVLMSVCPEKLCHVFLELRWVEQEETAHAMRMWRRLRRTRQWLWWLGDWYRRPLLRLR
ncbi:MAG TPA: hypothetical protein VMV29_14860 [Ktedonobacterales bacterium]|nr:hypothetical protein [Ktedonobacterales bacterium]